MNNNERSEEELRRDPNMIELFDKDGKPFFIPKDEYRLKVLPASFKKVWNDPEQLYSHIFFALKDGFCEEALDAAKRQKEIDSDLKRGYATYGVVLMHNKLFDEARNLFVDYINKYGDDAYILTYLAKTFDLKTDKKSIMNFLEKAIQIDPNQSDTLQFWTAVITEDKGREAFLKELTRLSQFPNTWRPQLWLAREYLIDKRKDEALKLYDHVLKIAKDQPGVLMKISGDLGSAGHTQDVLRLILPIYNPHVEDPFIGLNILQSFLETERIEEGRQFLEKMYELERPDIKKRLDAFKDQFDKRKSEYKLNKGTKYAILPVEETPHKLLEVLSKYFATKPNIESAYCARLYLFENDESSNIVAIKMNGRLSDIMDDLGKCTRGNVGSNQFVDYLDIGEGSLVQEELLKNFKPFYVRKRNFFQLFGNKLTENLHRNQIKGNPYPHQSKKGVIAFDEAVKDIMGQFAKEEKLKLKKIQECQWALWNNKLCFKIYLPDGHNFPINETVSPEFTEEWFGGNEIPLIIFYRFIGKADRYKDKGLERYSLEEIPGRINEIKDYFTEIRHYFDKPNRKELWENIQKLRRQQLQNFT